MLEIVLATLPIFLLIFLGTLVTRSKFVSRAFWVEAEKLIYYLLFPALLLSSVAKASLGGLEIAPMAGVVVGCMALATAALLLLRRRITAEGPAFTSLYQGVIRMNTYLGFAVAFAIGGQAAVEATAVAVAIFVPTANLLCVTILVRYGAHSQIGGGSALAKTLLAIAKNPLILSIVGGIVLNLTGIGLPPVIAPMLEILGRAALGLGLLAVGAGLEFKALRTTGPVVLLAVALKLLVMPALALGLVLLFGLTGPGALAVILLNALPTAGAAYILARQLGGDAPLMAAIITVQTGLAMLSLPLVLALVP